MQEAFPAYIYIYMYVTVKSDMIHLSGLSHFSTVNYNFVSDLTFTSRTQKHGFQFDGEY